MDQTAILVARARLGDTSAADAIVDGLREQIAMLSDVCAALGWTTVEVSNALVAAISRAIETFDGAGSFWSFAAESMVAAVRERLLPNLGAPN